MSEHEFWKDLGNIFDAVLNYQKKNVEFNNRFINPWIRLGNVFEHDDQANTAVEAYKHATELDPDNAQNWAELGDAQFKKAAYDDAVSAYQKSVALDPEAGWPIGNLALTMVTQGNVEEAIPLYLNSIELLSETKDKAVCWNRLGNAYRKLNDYENAFHAFQQADQLDGDNTGFSDKLDETQPNTVVIAPEEILEQLIVEQSLEDAVTESSMELEAPSETITQPEAGFESLLSVQVDADDELVEVMDEVLAAVVETALEEDESPLTLHENDFDILKVVEEVIAKVEEEFSAREDLELAAEEIAVEMDMPVENARSAQEVELVAALHEEIAVDEESATSAAAELEIVSEEITQEAELVAAIHEEIVAENELAISEAAELEIVSEELIQEAELVAAIHEEIVAENESVTNEAAKLDIVREEVTSVAEASEESTQTVEAVAETSVEIAAEVEPAMSEVIALEETNEEAAAEVESVENIADDVNTSRKIPAWLIVTDMVLEKLGLEETPKFVIEPAAEKLVEAEAALTLSDIAQDVVVNESAADMDIVETYTNSFALPAMLDANLNEESVSEIADPLEVQNDALTESSVSLESVVTENISMSVVEEQVTELAYEEYLKDVIEPIQILPDHVDAVQSEAPLTRVSQNGEVRIAMDTKNAHVWNELGNVYLNSGACEDAISSYSKAIDLDRHFAWPYSNLAFAYVHKGRFAEAILLYQRSIELFVTDKDKAVTWNRLGNVYRRINDYSNAIAAYHTADELDPENTTLSLRTSFGLLGNMQSDSKPAYVE